MQGSQADRGEAKQAEKKFILLAQVSSPIFSRKHCYSIHFFLKYHIFPRSTIFKSPSTLTQHHWKNSISHTTYLPIANWESSFLVCAKQTQDNSSFVFMPSASAKQRALKKLSSIPLTKLLWYCLPRENLHSVYMLTEGSISYFEIEMNENLGTPEIKLSHQGNLQ